MRIASRVRLGTLAALPLAFVAAMWPESDPVTGRVVSWNVGDIGDRGGAATRSLPA